MTAGLAAAAIPSLAKAQSPGDAQVISMDKEFAKPLSPEAKKLLTEALKGVESASKDRLKFKLPENSEPCFEYVASPREVRSK